MVHLDLEYIKSQSLWLDLKIIFLTLPAIISSKGAG
jgi:lipopolysaccharide/colanic/teichoic acid biosynthesis glycosyltransferase